ncbi:hypothetical protein FBUS_03393 [Fasciolopsis buskii]|uniref:Uncharacterized protein n=1 Tax=Fasciolopsis buskii TaxID=27845 RepID=A0A8E0SAJ1_9TREM|nr:hypothetical protein FBUS_03393 [Fasciolopsis buski]
MTTSDPVDNENVASDKDLKDSETISKSSNSTDVNEDRQKWRAYIGFGHDLNYLLWANSWICMTYFLSGLSAFLFHWYTYEYVDGTLKMECFGNMCWTAVREIRPEGHNYNLLKHHGQYLVQHHTGIWFGSYLMAFGFLAGFRFTRCVVNLGYFLNILLICLCVLVAPICALEGLTWFPGPRPIHEEKPICNWLKLRIMNDMVLVIVTLITAIIQLILNTPYIQHRSIRLMEPLLKAIKNNEQINFGWMSRQSPYHNIYL